MDEGLNYCKPQAQKIEHTNQNKVKCKVLCFIFFFFIILDLIIYLMVAKRVVASSCPLSLERASCHAFTIFAW